MKTFGIFTGFTRYSSKMLVSKIKAETIEDALNSDEVTYYSDSQQYVEVRPLKDDVVSKNDSRFWETGQNPITMYKD